MIIGYEVPVHSSQWKAGGIRLHFLRVRCTPNWKIKHNSETDANAINLAPNTFQIMFKSY